MLIAKETTMKKLRLRTTKEFTGKVAIEELQRAHVIIVLLSVSLAVLLGASVMQPLQFDTVLVSVAVVLLSIVAIVSFIIAIVLNRKKNVS